MAIDYGDRFNHERPYNEEPGARTEVSRHRFTHSLEKAKADGLSLIKILYRKLQNNNGLSGEQKAKILDEIESVLYTLPSIKTEYEEFQESIDKNA